MSFIRFRRCFPLFEIFPTDFSCFSFSSPYTCSYSRSENPIIELSGVLSSWLIFARKSLLVRFAASAICFSCRSFSAALLSVISLQVSRTPIIFPSSSVTGIAWTNQTLPSSEVNSPELLLPVRKISSSCRRSDNGLFMPGLFLRHKPTAF